MAGLKISDVAFLGRVGNSAVTPASFANLLAWWKADSFSLPDNTTIGGAGNEWVDQAGSNDATTGFGAVTYRTAGIGGALPSLEFSGESLSIGNIVFGASADFTIIHVAETGADSCWLGNLLGNVQIRRRRAGTNNASFFPGSGSEVISDNFSTSAGGIVMTTYRRSGTTVSFRENKTSRNSGSNGGGFTLDQIGRSAFTPLATGDLGELVVYTAHLSDADIDQLFDDYFQPKFSIP